MKKSEWLDCQRNEFFPKQKGIPSLVKIEHKNTATLDSARSKKKSKVAVLQLVRRQLSVSSSTCHRSLFCDQSCSNQPDQPLILKFCTTEISKERLSNARIRLRMPSLICALVRVQQNKVFSRPIQ